MKKLCFIGIDTSNYTTSLSVCDRNSKILLNYKKILDVSEGERGLRQSDAVFSHVRNLPDALSEMGKILKDYEPLAVGVSDRPRDAEGSYMPCFLSGVAVASAVSESFGVPLYRFSHQCGHIMAALASSGMPEEKLGEPFAAFHVSGGTTELVYVKPCEDGFSVELIGATEDLNAGQAIDRAGVEMGIKFPCGREMDMLASACHEKIFGISVSVKDCNCNLSGLENKAQKLYLETGDKARVSKYVFEFVAKTLLKMTENLYLRYPDITVLYAGGVMSNSLIKDRLSKRFSNVYFAEPQFSSDNAAGIALLTKKTYFK